jgi:four helix bundle protein
MRNDQDNIIIKLTLEFALDIIEYTELLEEHKKFVVARQLLRSGTSVGANVREAQNAESIAAKEADETEYWLTLCSLSNSYPKHEGIDEKLKAIILILSKINSSSKKLK